MIIEVEGQQVEVDDSFAKLSPDQQQAELQHIVTALKPPEASAPIDEATQANMVNPLYPTLAGAVAGEIGGPMVNKATEGYQASRAARLGTPPPAPKPTTAPGTVHTPYNPRGSSVEQSVENWRTYSEAQNEAAKKVRQESALHKKYPGFTRAGPPPATVQTPAPSLGAKIGAAMPGPIKDLGAALGAATQSGVAPWLGRAVAGAGTGFQGADAYNRAQQGDVSGAAISGIGALGSAASLIPHPVTRIGGAAIGMGAEALNMYLDELKKKSQGVPQAPMGNPMGDQVPQMASGGGVKAVGGGLQSLTKKLHEVLTPHEGKTLLATMADRTKATDGFQGGPGFINLHPDYTWAVDAPGVAKKHMEAVERFGGPERTVMAPMLMSKEAHKSNRPVFEQIYGDVLSKIKTGELSPEQIAAINHRIAIEKKADLSKNPGIESPDFLEFANAFNRRGAIADIFGLKKLGAADLQKHLDSTIDPALKEASTGAIGPQLFTMSGYENAPGIHGGYNIGFRGKKGADQFIPAEREFVFRDLEKQAREQMGRPMTDYNYRNILKEHGSIPNQFIDEQLLRGLQEVGHKKGGLV